MLIDIHEPLLRTYAGDVEIERLLDKVSRAQNDTAYTLRPGIFRKRSATLQAPARPASCSRTLPPQLVQFRELHPQGEIEVHTSVASEMERELDSTFEVIIEPLATSASAPDTRLLPNGPLFRRFALKALADQGRASDAAHESGNLAAIAAAAEAGSAVALLQRETVNFD